MSSDQTILAGRYRLLEKFASGGTAHIYRAIDEKTGQIVAVKILKPEFTKNEEFIQRFKKEVQASLKLHHANIIRAYDAGMDAGRYYIVMELIDGTTLKNLILSKGPLSQRYVVSVAKKLCLALEYAHVKGFIHRDIKPHNVMVDKNGEPYIADFGIARNTATNTITSEENSVMGSVHYFSPEQARGERVDKRTDIYSLGIVIYEMLTGKVPFDADSSIAIALKHINEPMPELADTIPDVPPSLNRIIQKATQKDKHFRYKSAFNMYEDLMRALSEPDGDYVKYTESKRSKQHMEAAQLAQQKKNARQLPKRVFVIIGLVVGCVLAGILIYRGQGRPAFLPTATASSLDTVSSSSADTVMPQVTDLPLERARAILSARGLQVSVVEQTQGTYSVGYVMEQSPLAGTPLAGVDSVTLTVKTAPGGYLAHVPDVASMSLSRAIGELRGSGFTQFFVYDSASGSAQPGTVVRQDPVGGTEQLTGDPVSLHIAPFDYPQYRYTGEVTVRAEEDDTSVQVAILQEVDGTPVYHVIADTTVEQGLHSIPLQTIGLNSDRPTEDASIAIILNNTPAQDWQVQLERVDSQ